MVKARARDVSEASKNISRRIGELGDWRGETLARVRRLVHDAVPGVVEEWKWRGTPVWSRDGILCTGESYKAVVKLTFLRGAALPDPKKLFNASLEGNARRAIDLREGDELPVAAFKALIKAAVAANGGARAPKRAKKPVRMLAGGNPQIARGDGDGPVREYLAALPGWKGTVARRVDALVTGAVPGVRKAVKWNSPFYGIEGKGWFLSLHAFTKYVKVGFFKGTSLRPLPPGESTSDEVRYIHIHEDVALDEAQFSAWAKQAAAIPGWVP